MKSSKFLLRSSLVLVILFVASSAKLHAQAIPPANPVESFDYVGYMAKWQDSTLNDKARLEAFSALVNQHNGYAKGPPPTEYMTVWYDDADKALALERKYNNLEHRYSILSYKLIYDLFFKDLDSLEACSRFEELLNITGQLNNPTPTCNVIALLYQLGPDCEFEAYTQDELRELMDAESNRLLNELDGREQLTNDMDINHIAELIDLHLGIGQTYMNKSEYPNALRHYLTAINLADQFQLFDQNVLFGMESVGVMHADIGNYKEAEKYFFKVIATADKLCYIQPKGSGNAELSKLYLKMGKPEEALEKVEMAISIMSPEAGFDVGCSLCVQEAYTAEAGVYNVLGEYEVALSKLSKIRSHFEDPYSGATPYARAFYYGEVAAAYLGLNQYKKAIEAAEKSLSFKSGRTYNEAKRAYQIIYQAEKALGNFERSLSAYEQKAATEESMTRLRNAQEVTRIELESAFKEEQLRDELAFQEQLNAQKNTRNLLIGLGLIVLILAVGLVFRLRYIRRTSRIIKSEKEKALASERAKHQFLANMSHEIRTPMNAIKGMTEILIRRNPKAEQKEYLDSIKQSSDSLLIVINDILDLSKIEASKIELEKEPFSINELMNNVHMMMQFKAEEKGLELMKDVPNEPLQVNGDATRLRQILVNLIGNAIKFTEKGVVVTRVELDNEGVHFTVSDTGVGIGADRLEKIFESFEQAYANTTRKFGGTGLGLSISKKLVELHGGKIWVESQKGKGSQFHFVIPYEIAEIQELEALPTDSQRNIAHELKGINILLVEDNQFNAVVAREELEDAIEAAQVDLAVNGAVAVEKVKSGHYDVILMDVQMPKMNGYEATKAIRNLQNGKANLPIIAMTANVLKEEVDTCYDAGMNDFIGKPFDTDDLVNKIYNLKFAKNE